MKRLDSPIVANRLLDLGEVGTSVIGGGVVLQQVAWRRAGYAVDAQFLRQPQLSVSKEVNLSDRSS